MVEITQTEAAEGAATPGPGARVSRVSVIVPHYNDLANLAICLDRLRAQTLGFENIEVVVADNMSDGGLEPVKAVCGPGVKVILATTRGPRPARNAGVAAASSPVLAFTDTDCSPDPAWLEEGLKALARFDVVGGAITVTVGAAERPTPVECFERVFAFKNRDYIEKQGYTVTDNMLTRRDLFDKVGGFVTTTIAEDVEWGRRVKRAGFTLGYAPAALDSHPARRDWPERSKKWKRILLQQFNETQACSHPRLRWLMRNFAILLSPLVHMFEVIRSDRLTGASQRLAAIAVLIHLRAWRSAEGVLLLFTRDVEDPWSRKSQKA